MTIIILGVFMAILDTSVVNVAIPKMETALNASTDQIQWVVTGYMLVLGMLIPISGWLTDKFGAKKLFLFALATFTIGSALCGIAWNLETIIIFRIVQALGGALMQPVAMSMIFRIYPPERRGTVKGHLRDCHDGGSRLWTCTKWIFSRILVVAVYFLHQCSNRHCSSNTWNSNDARIST
jgi:MFS family permease